MADLITDQIHKQLLDSDKTVADISLSGNYRRRAWSTLEEHLLAFLDGRRNRWLILPGLRGIGKTTLLAQLYNHPELNQKSIKKVYLSLDRLTLTGGSMAGLVEVLTNWRRNIYPDQPLLVFLDEVHHDPKWSLGCKVIFDQIPNVFLICTGSSALSLRLSPDSARRATIIEINPLSFDEFVALGQFSHDQPDQTVIPEGLRDDIRSALMSSADETEVYQRLAVCEPAINDYHSQILARGNRENPDPAHSVNYLIDKYINGFGSLPLFASQPATVDGLAAARDDILQVIDRTVVGDIVKLGEAGESLSNFQLQTSTINALPGLLHALANSDRVSLTKLAQKLGGTHQQTLRVMLDVLVTSGLVIDIPARGRLLAKNNNLSPKYLFASPALRQALVPLSSSYIDGNDDYSRNLRGRLLEDTVAMSFTRLFTRSPIRRFIEYDARAGGADFIVYPEGLAAKPVIVEAGYGKKTARQIQQTMKRGGQYGLVVTSNTSLRVDTKQRTTYVPLDYFLLM